MTPIRYLPGIPPEVATVLEPIIERWKFLLPTWCQDLRIEWKPDLDGDIAETSIHYANRWAVIRVAAPWLDGEPADRETVIIHEMIHVTMEPLQRAAFTTVDTLTEKDSPAYRLAERQIRDGTEAVAEDLARAMYRRP